MTRILLVRHGETDWNRRGRVQGRADVPLNARGRRDGWVLRERLSEYPTDAAIVSPLVRVRETADLVLAGRGVTPVADRGLTEVDYGVWQGTTAAERIRADVCRARLWERADPAAGFVGGETLLQFRRRVVAAWRRLVRKYGGGTVLVVAHGHVNRLILLEVSGRPLDQFWEIEQPNGAAAVVDVNGTRGRVRPL